jgi:hypothetical protein
MLHRTSDGASTFAISQLFPEPFSTPIDSNINSGPSGVDARSHPCVQCCLNHSTVCFKPSSNGADFTCRLDIISLVGPLGWSSRPALRLDRPTHKSPARARQPVLHPGNPSSRRILVRSRRGALCRLSSRVLLGGMAPRHSGDRHPPSPRRWPSTPHQDLPGLSRRGTALDTRTERLRHGARPRDDVAAVVDRASAALLALRRARRIAGRSRTAVASSGRGARCGG